MIHLDEDVLNEYLDDLLDAGQARTVEAHLEGCPACRQRLDMLRAVFQALDDLPDEPLTRDLSAVILARLPATQAQPLPRARQSGTWLASWRLPVLQALAAILLLAATWPFVSQGLVEWLEPGMLALQTLPPAVYSEMAQFHLAQDLAGAFQTLAQSFSIPSWQTAGQSLAAWRANWMAFHLPALRAFVHSLAAWRQSADALFANPFSPQQWLVLLGVAGLAWLAANRRLLKARHEERASC